jgi:hypothetical protein
MGDGRWEMGDGRWETGIERDGRWFERVFPTQLGLSETTPNPFYSGVV